MDASLRYHQLPIQKFKDPITSSMEIGWDLEPFVCLSFFLNVKF